MASAPDVPLGEYIRRQRELQRAGRYVALRQLALRLQLRAGIADVRRVVDRQTTLAARIDARQGPVGKLRTLLRVSGGIPA
jgi:hypothetical protein